MQYYHCSPIHGLKILEARKPTSFSKPKGVYLTTLLPMALMYGIKNYEYTYGYTKEGQIYLDEYFPDALNVLYRGKSASLYYCAPAKTTSTPIPNEAVCETDVPVAREVYIPDVYDALMEQVRMGTLVIHRYEELSEKQLEWVKQAEAGSIREQDLLNHPGPMADYYRLHYPESWAMVMSEKTV